MIVDVVRGVGTGITCVSAFDAALYDAGIANYNLIKLSSIIPVNFEIKVLENKRDTKPQEYGNKLYVILARMDQNVEGKYASAGLGWIQKQDGSGMFVEHNHECQAEVVSMINSSLSEMLQRRVGEYSNIFTLTSSIACLGKPVSAIVAAIYKSESWF